MLEHLRRRVVTALASTKTATLSSWGAASIQAGILPCAAVETRFFMLVPATSDHLLNLESNRDVVVTTEAWEMQGTVVFPDQDQIPPTLPLCQLPEARLSRLVEVRPVRLHVRQPGRWGFSETIDL